MNTDFLGRIAGIQQRVSEIQSRFGHEPHFDGFERALGQSERQAQARPVLGAAAPERGLAEGASLDLGPQTGGSGAYQSAIAGAAARHGVDSALVRAVVSAESGGNPRATSPVGAMGLMQLMPGTARDLGVDNPYDPAQNIEGGTKYLAELTQRFGLEKGVAAYNAGPGAVERHGGVPPYPETRHYVNKVLSLYNEFKR